MKDELARSVAALKQRPTPPYSLADQITETHSISASREPRSKASRAPTATGGGSPVSRGVARQSSLLVEVASPSTAAGLRAALLEQLQKEDRPFALLFEGIQGGGA
jgi:hypothetical protein